jgi:hypothetical protein
MGVANLELVLLVWWSLSNLVCKHDILAWLSSMFLEIWTFLSEAAPSHLHFGEFVLFVSRAAVMTYCCLADSKSERLAFFLVYKFNSFITPVLFPTTP